jgi:hypothetical protein
LAAQLRKPLEQTADAALGNHAAPVPVAKSLAANQIFKVQVVPVPEPATAVLLGLAIVCLAGLIGRRSPPAI